MAEDIKKETQTTEDVDSGQEQLDEGSQMLIFNYNKDMCRRKPLKC